MKANEFSLWKFCKCGKCGLERTAIPGGRCPVCDTPYDPDAAALASDWAAVGEDLKSAIESRPETVRCWRCHTPMVALQRNCPVCHAARRDDDHAFSDYTAQVTAQNALVEERRHRNLFLRCEEASPVCEPVPARKTLQKPAQTLQEWRKWGRWVGPSVVFFNAFMLGLNLERGSWVLAASSGIAALAVALTFCAMDYALTRAIGSPK